jgi:hypothetical protein
MHQHVAAIGGLLGLFVWPVSLHALVLFVLDSMYFNG